MAEPRKAVAAKGAAKSDAQSPAKSARSPARAPKTPAAGDSGLYWLRATLTIFALFCVVGAIPAALGGETFGYWRLPITSYQLAAPPWALSYDPPLARPLPMLANATLHVVATPGGSATIATLEPGFATQVTRYATRAGVRWAQIRWAGPTRASGGSGWTLASGLIAANAATLASQPRDIGDLGALSPAMGQAVNAIGSGFATALYFGAAQASYRTSDIDQVEPLGGQIVPLVLTLLYAKGIVASQPNAASGPPPIARDLASGNAQALTFDYALVGDAQGMDSFLTQHQIAGFQFAAQQPLQAKGSVRALSLFYAALSGGALVNAHDQAEIISLLASVNNSAAAAVTPASVIGSGALLLTTASADGGVASIAAGVLAPANGAAVVVVASVHGATAAAAQTAMRTYFGRLIPIIQG